MVHTPSLIDFDDDVLGYYSTPDMGNDNEECACFMGDVIKFRRPKAAEKHKGKGLCKSGFHRWEVVQERPFDVTLNP